MDGWMGMDGWTDGRTDGRTDRWMDGWIGGWMDGWMDGRTDGSYILHIYVVTEKYLLMLPRSLCEIS